MLVSSIFIALLSLFFYLTVQCDKLLLGHHLKVQKLSSICCRRDHVVPQCFSLLKQSTMDGKNKCLYLSTNNITDTS